MKNLYKALHLLEMLQSWKISHMSCVWTCKLGVIVYMGVLSSSAACVWCQWRGYNPELWTTTSIWSSARTEWGTSWMDQNARSWSNDAAMQTASTLCLSSSHYASDISRADGQICSEHHSLHHISDGSFLSILSKSVISALTFRLLWKGSPWRLQQTQDKSPVYGLLLSQRSRLWEPMEAWKYSTPDGSLLSKKVLWGQTSKDQLLV